MHETALPLRFILREAVFCVCAPLPGISQKGRGSFPPKKIMKRIAILLAALVLALILTVNALAESAVTRVYDAAWQLLFNSSNVTMEGHAEFSLDGAWFKTADGTYVQDGERSLWKLALNTPRSNGTERAGGYTVIADGENVYVMEVFDPGIYRTGLTAASNTILRRSAQLSLVTDLLRLLAGQADALLGDALSVTESGEGTEMHVQLDGNTPEPVNAALNLAAQFAAERYFGMDFDHLTANNPLPMASFITPTEGILYCTEHFALRQADVTVKLDAAGRLSGISGSASVTLETISDGDRVLDASFSLQVSGWGESHVDPFDPAAYDVIPYYEALTMPDVPEEAPEPIEPDTAEAFMQKAGRTWHEAGFSDEGITDGEYWIYRGTGLYDSDLIYVDFATGDMSTMLRAAADNDYNLLQLELLTNAWDLAYDQRREDAFPDEALAAEATAKLLTFLQEANPGAAGLMDSLEQVWWLEAEGEKYLCVRQALPDDGSIDAVMRVAPAWRLEHFDCYNPAERP